MILLYQCFDIYSCSLLTMSLTVDYQEVWDIRIFSNTCIELALRTAKCWLYTEIIAVILSAIYVITMTSTSSLEFIHQTALADCLLHVPYRIITHLSVGTLQSSVYLGLFLDRGKKLENPGLAGS